MHRVEKSSLCGNVFVLSNSQNSGGCVAVQPGNLEKDLFVLSYAVQFGTEVSKCVCCVVTRITKISSLFRRTLFIFNNNVKTKTTLKQYHKQNIISMVRNRRDLQSFENYQGTS